MLTIRFTSPVAIENPFVSFSLVNYLYMCVLRRPIICFAIPIAGQLACVFRHKYIHRHAHMRATHAASARVYFQWTLKKSSTVVRSLYYVRSHAHKQHTSKSCGYIYIHAHTYINLRSINDFTQVSFSADQYYVTSYTMKPIYSHTYL